MNSGIRITILRKRKEDSSDTATMIFKSPEKLSQGFLLKGRMNGYRIKRALRRSAIRFCKRLQKDDE